MEWMNADAEDIIVLHLCSLLMTNDTDQLTTLGTSQLRQTCNKLLS